jgi:EAL domain-containing protein (putative c-di-GMP-specific phosphodiesterase class I)
VQASGWQSVLPGVGVAVNLSPRQFAGRDLASDVARALDGLAPQLLTVEVTEGALVADPAAAAEQLERLAGTGVRIALDDFGTGYSSLAYLKRLPVHTVKIDKVFVDGVESDTGDRAIVRAVLALARDLGLHVIAEGVETPRQRDALLALGCTWAQGYLFSRPVSLDRLQQACGDAERVAAALNASA